MTIILLPWWLWLAALPLLLTIRLLRVLARAIAISVRLGVKLAATVISRSGRDQTRP